MRYYSNFRNLRIRDLLIYSPNLSGSSSIYGNGYLENVYNNFFDVGADGLYNREEYVSQNKSNYDYLSGYKFVLNNSYSIQNLVLGLKLILSNSKQENNRNNYPLGVYKFQLTQAYYSDPTFQQEYLLTDLHLNTPMTHYSEQGVFDTYNERPLTFIDASSSMTVINTNERSLEFRGDLLYSKYENNSSSNDLYNGSYANYNYTVPSYILNYAINDGYTSISKENGSWIGLKGEARYTFNRQGTKDR